MTTCLDMDIGNSRIKWRFGTSQGISSHDRLPEVSNSIDRVRISTVRRNQVELGRRCEELYGIKPAFANSTKSLVGVTCAYSDPSMLGVDRWLAICAAWHATNQACIVVDAGTALTIDVVADDGQHLGGYIVPGLTTMQKQLKDATEQVEIQTENTAGSVAYGADTRSCVTNGALRMCSEFVNGVVASNRWAKPSVYVTGGDVPALMPYFDHDVLHRPYLVLDGLALALP